MGAPELSYKENNWCLHLLDAAGRLQSEEMFCDTLIVTLGGDKIMAHSCILAAAASSSLLAPSVLQPSCSNSKTLHVNATLSSVQKVIQFVYSGEVFLQDLETMNEVCNAAKELHIETLERWCREQQKSCQQIESQEPSESGTKSRSGDDFSSSEGENPSFIQIRQTDKIRKLESQPIQLPPRKKPPGSQTDNIRELEFQPMQLQPRKKTPRSKTRTKQKPLASTLSGNKESDSLTHAGNRPFNCAHCDMSFGTKSNLSRHLRCHSGQKPFLCKQCGASFSRADILKRHEFSHTPDNRPMFKCSFCEKTFSREHGLKLHEEYHKNPSKNECSVCHKTYADVINLRDHMLTHDRQKKFACQTCGRQFINKKRLHQHEKIHQKDRPRRYECTSCQKKFLSRQALDCHQTIHSGDKPFKCKFCPQRFSQYSNCYAHEKLHSGKKDFVCETCGAAFAKHTQLKEHRLIHNEEKAYKCDNCDKSFRQMRNLKLHEQIHFLPSQRTKHQCDLCSKSFLTSQGKINHTRKMHSSQKVGCRKHFTNNFTRERYEEKEHNLKDLPVGCTEVSLGEVQEAFITKTRKRERVVQLLGKQSTGQRFPSTSVDSLNSSANSQSSALTSTLALTSTPALTSAPALASAPALTSTPALTWTPALTSTPALASTPASAPVPESVVFALDSNNQSADFEFSFSPLMHDSGLDTSLSGLQTEDLMSASDLQGVTASLLESMGL